MGPRKISKTFEKSNAFDEIKGIIDGNDSGSSDSFAIATNKDTDPLSRSRATTKPKSKSKLESMMLDLLPFKKKNKNIPHRKLLASGGRDGERIGMYSHEQMISEEFVIGTTTTNKIDDKADHDDDLLHRSHHSAVTTYSQLIHERKLSSFESLMSSTITTPSPSLSQSSQSKSRSSKNSSSLSSSTSSKQKNMSSSHHSTNNSSSIKRKTHRKNTRSLNDLHDVVKKSNCNTSINELINNSNWGGDGRQKNTETADKKNDTWATRTKSASIDDDNNNNNNDNSNTLANSVNEISSIQNHSGECRDRDRDHDRHRHRHRHRNSSDGGDGEGEGGNLPSTKKTSRSLSTPRHPRNTTTTPIARRSSRKTGDRLLNKRLGSDHSSTLETTTTTTKPSSSVTRGSDSNRSKLVDHSTATATATATARRSHNTKKIGY